MGVRYLAFIGDPRGDRLRPKKIDPRSDDHLSCPSQIKGDFRNMALEGNIEDYNLCCENCCLYVIYNLTHSDSWDDEILAVKSFKIKHLYIIYVVNNDGRDIEDYKCNLVEELIDRNLNHNGSILTEGAYKKLIYKKLGGKTLLQTTKILEDIHKKTLKGKRCHVSFYKFMRDNMSQTIKYYLELDET